MYGTRSTQQSTEARHAANNNRFNPENDDRIVVLKGKRTYQESRKLEHEKCVENNTCIGN